MTPAEQAEGAEREGAKASDSSDSIRPEDWAAIGRDTKRRRELLSRLFAVNPRLVQKEIAKQFQVDEDTIGNDMRIIRAAAGERALNQVAEVGETLEQYARITKDALADAPQVQVDSNARAAHRNTALKALDQKVNVLFRLGYWQEAAKQINLSGMLDLSVLSQLSPETRTAVTEELQGAPANADDDEG